MKNMRVSGGEIKSENRPKSLARNAENEERKGDSMEAHGYICCGINSNKCMNSREETR